MFTFGVRLGLFGFKKSDMKSDPILAIFIKQHPNTSKNIRFFAVFVYLIGL
jgi:hypothetical protein